MRKSLLFSLIFFMLLLQVSFAQVEILPEKTSCVVETGQVVKLNVTVENKQTFDDTFTISLFPSSFFGTSILPERTAISIPRLSSKSFLILVSSSLEAKEVTTFVKLSLTSLITKKIYSKDILIKVVRAIPVHIQSITLSKYILKPSESFNVKVEVRNLEESISEKYWVVFMLLKDSKLIHKEVKDLENIPPLSSSYVTFSYKFGKYQSAGDYKVRILLKDSKDRVIDEKIETVKLKEVKIEPSQYIRKEVKYGILKATVIITIKNEGNVETGPFYLTESLPAFAKNFFFPTIEPDFEKAVNGRIVYGWLIKNINPGESVQITYTIFLVHFWLALLFIVFIVYFSIRITFAPTILKIPKHFGPITKEKEIKITLSVKNKGRREMRNVRVVDKVPPIARVLKKFDTLPPTKIKASKEGTVLEWRFRKLKPKEERILTYYIRPVVDVIGELKLPAAILEAGKKGKKKIIKSGTVSIKSE